MKGYRLLSCLLGTSPDLAICRKFKSAHAYNVLVLQAEILHLQYALRSATKADRDADARAGRSPLDQSILDLSEFRLNGSPTRQWTLTVELRSKLKEYDEAKAQFQRACQSPPVRSVNLRTLRKWLEIPDGGDKFLKGLESTTWIDEIDGTDEAEADLTSLLDTSDKEDAISRWLSDNFLPWFHKTIWYRFKPHQLPLYEPSISDKKFITPIDLYSESTITFIVTSFSTILSSLLPCLSIFILYHVRPPVIRLSIILVLSTLFSTAVTFIARAKRENCFSSTAAFAAVLVVFVGSTDSSTCACPAR